MRRSYEGYWGRDRAVSPLVMQRRRTLHVHPQHSRRPCHADAPATWVMVLLFTCGAQADSKRAHHWGRPFQPWRPVYSQGRSVRGCRARFRDMVVSSAQRSLSWPTTDSARCRSTGPRTSIGGDSTLLSSHLGWQLGSSLARGHTLHMAAGAVTAVGRFSS